MICPPQKKFFTSSIEVATPTRVNMKVFLLGLPGSGKTTLGKALAAELPLAFVDLDLEIENAAGKTIKEIFSESGEQRFRELESWKLTEWCASGSDFIMATGGGTPCFADNLKRMNEAGVSIFLDVPVSEIVRRMESVSLIERPLLGSLLPAEVPAQLDRLRSQRLIFYQQAMITLSGENITPEEIKKHLIVKREIPPSP